MSKKLFFLISLFCFFGIYGKAQTDSTDLDFYATLPQMSTADDSLMYSFGDFTELHLDFELSNPTNFGKVYIELGVVEGDGILYRRNYNLTQLSELDLIEDNLVSIFLGVFENTAGFQVSVTIENQSGLLSQIITKTIFP